MQESDGKTAVMNAARNGLQKQWTSLRIGRGTRRLLVDGADSRLAPQPWPLLRNGVTLTSPPSSVDSVLIPSCPIPSDPAGRSASSSGAQTGPHTLAYGPF